MLSISLSDAELHRIVDLLTALLGYQQLACQMVDKEPLGVHNPKLAYHIHRAADQGDTLLAFLRQLNLC